jgi:predicted transposase YbfD/YdcC
MRFLEQVNLSGAIVIGDAMHTQRTTSEQILQADDNFIWTAKGNQAHTEWAIQKLFIHEVCNVQQAAPLSKDIQVALQVNKGHGRREKQTICASSQLNDYLDWPGLKQVFRLERVIWHEKQQGSTREVVNGMA